MNASEFALALLADASDSGDLRSTFFILACAFLLAALIWLVIWLLLGSGDTLAKTSTTEPLAAVPAPAPKAAPEPEPEPVPVSEPEPEPEPTPEPEPVTEPEPVAKPKPAAKKTSAPLPEIDTATSAEAAAAFREELDSGKVRQEEVMGILYNEAPTEPDDLKLIKGVAKVLEGKLHDYDVYTFKQIAFWTDDAAREFGAKLSFRDRIFRDDWIAQAKKFHEEKYGEKL